MIDYKNFEDYDNHEEVVEFGDGNVSGFIAIHSTKVGPALGGTRMFPYTSKEEALRDALRLSRAMSYKCAIAGLPYGGGKGVIVANPNMDKTPALLEAYAEQVNKLNGKFFTGEDVGLYEADVQYMLKFSRYMIGKSDQAGDPSAFAALSVFKCLEVVLGEVLGSSSFEGKTIAVKGLGKTGSALVELLHERGAKIYAADSGEFPVRTAKQKFPGLEIISPLEIHKMKVDIYSPCALGDEITEENVGEFGAKIICGTANNQLKTKKAGDLLYQRGIAYIPDYLANAGGLINVADELEAGGYNKDRVLQRIDSLKGVCKHVLDLSKQQTRPEYRVADQIAEEFIASQIKEKVQ